MAQWISYVDAIGYIDFDKFMKLPSGILDYVITIRGANRLKSLYSQRDNESNADMRKKLNNNIKELEAFFK